MLSCILIFNIAAMTACKEDMPPYENIALALDNYRSEYSKYRNAGDSNMTSYDNESQTRHDGTPCKSYYIKSFDGKYETVTLEYEKDNLMMVDEYFYLTEKAFYVVTSYFDEETMTPYITSYYVWYGDMYEIDEESSSLKEVDDAATAGYYLSFDELVAAYGPVEQQ